MEILFEIDKKNRTHSGKPIFLFYCNDCRKMLSDLSAYMYEIKKYGGTDPVIMPKQAAQEFVWSLNSGKKHPLLPEKTYRSLCRVLCWGSIHSPRQSSCRTKLTHITPLKVKFDSY